MRCWPAPRTPPLRGIWAWGPETVVALQCTEDENRCWISADARLIIECGLEVVPRSPSDRTQGLEQMTSERQEKANRSNARQSTGPKTFEGKRAVRVPTIEDMDVERVAPPLARHGDGVALHELGLRSATTRSACCSGGGPTDRMVGRPGAGLDNAENSPL